jgi:preprotein translocase subunit SecE
MTISKWVNLCYAGLFIFVFVVLDKSAKWLFTSVEALHDTRLMGNYVTVTSVIACVTTIALIAQAYRKQDTFDYISEIITELQRVTWPRFEEVKRSTLIVILFTIFVSAYLAGFDWIWKNVTDLLLSPAATTTGA